MIKIAAIQFDSQILAVEQNLERIEKLATQAAGNGARLLVFPECAITGYGLSPEEAGALAEPVPGMHSERLEVLCSRLKIYLMAGTLERGQDGSLYNCALLAGPQGLISHYRKTHLPHLGVDRYLKPGAALPPPVQTEIGRLGTLICYDLRFPEPARCLALQGAQVVLLSTAWPRAATLYTEFVARARAAENRVFLVAANRCGEERGTQYLGRSLIVDPEGRVLAEASEDQETILYAEIDPSHADTKHLIFDPGVYELNTFSDRRPDLYRPLCE